MTRHRLAREPTTPVFFRRLRRSPNDLLPCLLLMGTRYNRPQFRRTTDPTITGTYGARVLPRVPSYFPRNARNAGNRHIDRTSRAIRVQTTRRRFLRATLTLLRNGNFTTSTKRLFTIRSNDIRHVLRTLATLRTNNVIPLYATGVGSPSTTVIRRPLNGFPNYDTIIIMRTNRVLGALTYCRRQRATIFRHLHRLEDVVTTRRSSTHRIITLRNDRVTRFPLNIRLNISRRRRVTLYVRLANGTYHSLPRQLKTSTKDSRPRLVRFSNTRDLNNNVQTMTNLFRCLISGDPLLFTRKTSIRMTTSHHAKCAHRFYGVASNRLRCFSLLKYVIVYGHFRTCCGPLSPVPRSTLFPICSRHVFIFLTAICGEQLFSRGRNVANNRTTPVLRTHATDPDDEAADEAVGAILLPILLYFFLQPTILQLLTRLLHTIILLLPRRQLPTILQL